tara:strand:- start:103279 stop:103785 length:507 start_codon:yes stop_codon:yes gene_type:complete
MDILDAQNPLETVETILEAQEWQFERLSEDQILVEVSGQNGEYKLQLNWQEKMSALQITVQTDICYSSYQYTEAASIIAGINSKLWMGHFELSAEQLSPTFRYTCFLRGLTSFNGSDYLAEIIEVALCESEKHHSELLNLLRSEDEKALHIYGEDHYNLAYLAAAGNA